MCAPGLVCGRGAVAVRGSSWAEEGKEGTAL